MSTKARDTGLVLYEKTEKVATTTLNRERGQNRKE